MISNSVAQVYESCWEPTIQKEIIKNWNFEGWIGLELSQRLNSLPSMISKAKKEVTVNTKFSA